jgi:DNA ligase (NAD+)
MTSNFQSLTKPSVFSALPADEQLNVLLHYQNTYENNLPDQISDTVFDSLVSLYEKQTGLKYKEIGAVPSGNKETLPYYMGSLDKAKGASAPKDIADYLSKYPGPKVLEDKIDGNSGLYLVRYINGELIRKLYTRGNGYVGTDISHLLNFIPIPIPEFDIVVRGELAIPLEAFKSYKSGTGITQVLKNARNAGSGVVNSKEINEDLAKAMKFYAYNIVDWPYDKINAEKQLEYLKAFNFDIPWYAVLPSEEVNTSELEKYLKKRRLEAPYDIDGLVISDNAKFYPIEVGKNPKSMIAFKVDVYIQTTVVDVEWAASKDGVLKPVVIYEPVEASGVTMMRASGKNAKFIVNNNIGPGAVILITRAGDVIPDIIDVISPGTDGAKLPSGQYSSYAWNETEVEFILTDASDNDTVQKGKIEYFMTQLDIKNVGPGRIALLHDNGFDTLYKILSAEPEEFAKIEGLGKKSGKQIYDNIHNAINPAPLANVMAASGVFGSGFGVKKFELVLEVYPNILEYANKPKSELTSLIQKIPGYDKTSDIFAEHLPDFVVWLEEHPMIKVETYESAFTGDEEIEEGYIPMNGLKIVFTGFRSSEMEDKIKSRGGSVSTSVNKNTSYLVAKDTSDLKGKGAKAQELGINIISVEDFKILYNL